MNKKKKKNIRYFIQNKTRNQTKLKIKKNKKLQKLTKK